MFGQGFDSPWVHTPLSFLSSFAWQATTFRSIVISIKKKECVPRSLVRSGTKFMFYVYIIKSLKDKSFYVGVSSNLKARFKEHQDGRVDYTSNHRPFEIVWYCSFRSKIKAYNFEKYLKSSSGFAFRNKHLI